MGPTFISNIQFKLSNILWKETTISCFWPNLTSHLNHMVISLKFFWKQFDQKLVLVLKKHTSPLISTKLNDYFTSNPSKIYRITETREIGFPKDEVSDSIPSKPITKMMLGYACELEMI